MVQQMKYGMFEMEGEGMQEIANPSDILISERSENPAGSVIVATMEGTRPLLVELQALTTQTIFGFPRRTANGIDYNRLTLLMAVIEKRAGITLSNQDAYLNVVRRNKNKRTKHRPGNNLKCMFKL